jgi:5'-nucleotidase / UDP-sugar diphosphatase
MRKLRSLAGLAKKAAGVLALPALAAAAMATATTGGGGCVTSEAPPPLKGQVHLTLIHTSDIHSRLFPYNLQLGQVDAGLGLGAAGSIANVGGVARISHIIGRERARSSRVLHLDGGDCFQGAPIFNFYAGEAEIRALSAMGVDAMIVANHEFDRGALNLGIQLQNWADYPVLAANYLLEEPTMPGNSPLGTVIQPFTTFNLDGLKVAVIGMGNLSSITSIFEAPNRLGITPLNTIEVAQFYVDLLRPAVDVIVFVTHLGLEVDERMIENTTGIDVVLGGHNHIVLQPPKRVRDCSQCYEESCDGQTISTCSGETLECTGEKTRRYYIELASDAEVKPGEPDPKVKRYCTPREVVLVHSGAFAKFVSRLDLVVTNVKEDYEVDAEHVYDPLNGFEPLTYEFKLFPVTENEPNDPIVYEMLEPYGQGLDALANLDLLVGYALDGSRRFSTTGGDSPLGNMIATAMWLRLGVQTDFSMTNTTGIRADLVPGPVTVEQMYNIFPFDNSISKMQLSGIEVEELFDFAARRSSGRGCVSQIQIAGARIVIDCSILEEGEGRPGKATHIYIGTSTKACSSDADCGGEFGSCDVEGTGRCWTPIDPFGAYELATSNYLAQGGSGFRVLQRNTTQFDTQIQQRDALIDYMRAGAPCGADEDGDLVTCSTDADCAPLGSGNVQFVCACAASSVDCSLDPERCKEPAVSAEAGTVCKSDPEVSCGAGGGACVLAKCRDDVAAFQRTTCEAAATEGVKKECESALLPCAAGGEQCKFLACVDRRLGNFSDGRLRMVGQ